jgi:hypothetical protein
MFYKANLFELYIDNASDSEFISSINLFVMNC